MLITLFISSFLLNCQVNLHITSLKYIVTAHSILSSFGGFVEARNLARSYLQQMGGSVVELFLVDRTDGG